MAIETERIATGNDDGWVRDTPSFDNTGARIIIGLLSDDIFGNWHRFQLSDVPQGANIIAAKLTVKAYATDAQDNNMKVKIHCEAADNPTAPTSVSNFNSRVRTTAFTEWNNPEAWTINSFYDTPDFASSVQEVISRGGWALNNYLQVLMDDNGSTFEEREWWSYNGTTTECALLTVEYSIPGVGGGALPIFW